TTDGGNVSTGANITLTSPGTVDDDANATALVLNAGTAGTISLDGAIGANTPIAALRASGATIDLNGGLVTTAGDQRYDGAVVLDSATNSTSLAGSNVTFNSTVRSATNGEEALSVKAPSFTTFNGEVGDNNQALASLTTPDANSTTR